MKITRAVVAVLAGALVVMAASSSAASQAGDTRVRIKLSDDRFRENERISGHYNIYFFSGGYWYPGAPTYWCPAYEIFRVTPDGLKKVQTITRRCTDEGEIPINFRLKDGYLSNAAPGTAVDYVLKAYSPGHQGSSGDTARKAFEVVAAS